MKKILMFVGATLESKSRSGIQTVVVEIAKSLGNFAAIEFVKWDPLDGQLRYIDAVDLVSLFSTSERIGRPHRMAHRVQYRFGDTIEEPNETWLLLPEISYHEPNSSDVFARIISQAREYGIRTAAIFYDLIPITNTSYHELASRHVRYVAELLRADRIIPISAASANTLRDHYRVTFGMEEIDAWTSKIVPLLLPELDSEAKPPSDAPRSEEQVIVMVGTVEPRKRQVETLQTITKLQADGAISAAIQIYVFGSLHPAVAHAFHSVLDANPRIKYFNYAPKDLIVSSYKKAMFSIFASNDEGYGLPIAESLAQGVPCLTADFGAMAEVALGGGCLTCDVNDTAALAASIRSLCIDESLRHRLREEIKRRRFKDWGTYCRELVQIFEQHDTEVTATTSGIQAAVKDALILYGDSAPMVAGGSVTATDMGPGMRIVAVERARRTQNSADPRTPFTVCRFLDASTRSLPPEAANRALRADLWGVVSVDIAESWINHARDAAFPGLLPGNVVVDSEPSTLATKLSTRAALEIATDRRRISWADDEYLFQRALHHWRAALPIEERPLTLGISTYNRAPFVEKNVAWLIEVVRSLGRDIQIIVVDNASTDDTVSRLSKFSHVPFFSLIVNPQNTGMLGNLRICSSLFFSARHIWFTGDDDFILPEQLKAILDVLEDQPGLPLACVNLAVYYRKHLTAGDRVETLVAERQNVATQDVLPSGIYPVNVVATQHDNFFTAFYPIIFRSDLLAACFNYPFDGVPFGDLTECVPTTKWFLENYRYVDCYWHAPVGIVGNAHNSWSHHRPRWHGVIMPQIFELARDAGADPTTLNQFAQIHVGLYDEAIQIAAESRVPISIAPSDLAPAYRVFRAKLPVPQCLSAQ